MTKFKPRNCAVCGVEFTPRHRDTQTHCTMACMQRRERPRVPLEERFWRYLTPGAPDECWEWQGTRDQHGYGRIQRGGRNGGHVKAHRASLEIHRGPIPEGMAVCHRCDNPPCCNPAHLFIGTQRVNMHDKIAKGRSRTPVGDANGRTRIPDATVRAIRIQAHEGMPYTRIAAFWGLTDKYVGYLVRGERRAAAGGPIRV